MSTNIKYSQSQLSKRIQSGGFLCKTLGNIMDNLGKTTLLAVAFLWLRRFAA